MGTGLRGLAPFAFAVILFFGSEAALAYLGYVKVYLVLFVPVIVSTSPLAFAPLMFFLIPLLYPLISLRNRNRLGDNDVNRQEPYLRVQKGETRIGGIVMIGPIPIIFGKGIGGRVLVVLALIMLTLLILWFVFTK